MKLLLENLFNRLNQYSTEPYFAHALSHYSDTWNISKNTISNKKMMSNDLSASYYHTCPAIFLGTNDWATKRFCSESLIINRAKSCANHLLKQSQKLQASQILIIIPEKDFVIDYILGTTETHHNWNIALEVIMETLNESDLSIIDFFELTSTIAKCHTLKDYEYPDSHLLGLDYINIANMILENNNISNLTKPFNPKINTDEIYFHDLSAKLYLNNADFPYEMLAKDMYEQLLIVDGNDNFAEPLGDTYQKIKNNKAHYYKKITIYGDSHCSIIGKGKLTDLFALQFETTNFYWNPWGLRSDISSNKSDLYLFEISQRFLT